MKSTINGLRIAIVVLTGYWLLLFVGTHLPPNQLLSSLRVSDKLVHACAFAGLAFLIAWAVPTNSSKLHQNVLIAALIAIVYAVLDELLQIPVGRTADWLDFLADCVGIFVGLTTYSLSRAVILKAQWNLFQDPASSK